MAGLVSNISFYPNKKALFSRAFFYCLAMKNHIITGIPRSGTSLLSSLIAEHSRAIVFSEPDWLKDLRKDNGNCDALVNALEIRLYKLREQIRKGEPISLKIDPFTNKLVRNYYQRKATGSVKAVKNETDVVFPAEFAEAPFYVKANAQFTACLKYLSKMRSLGGICCVIRNPVSCLLSWRSLSLPVSSGNLKIAETYSGSYREMLCPTTSLLHKQVLILDWFFKQYHEYESKRSITIVRYEDLIKSPTEILCRATGEAIKAEVELSSKNNSKHYPLEEKEKITAYLEKFGVFYRHYYSFEDLRR